MGEKSFGECEKPGCNAPRFPRRKVCRQHANEQRNLQLRERRLKVHAAVRQYLAANPCADCGEKDTIVLQFDHRNPADKSHTVSDMISRGRSQKAIFEEIKKCDVRCANCHARRTAQQLGYYR